MNSDRLYSLVDREILYASPDGACNWGSILDLSSEGKITRFAVGGNDDDDWLYAAKVTHLEGTGPVSDQPTVKTDLIVSENGGADWEPRSQGLPPFTTAVEDLDVARSDPEVAYLVLHLSGSTVLYRTGNGGQAWDLVGEFVEPSLAVRFLDLKVDPLDADNIWMLAYGTLMHSDDGGATWVEVPIIIEGEDRSGTAPLWFELYRTQEGPTQVIVGGSGGGYSGDGAFCDAVHCLAVSDNGGDDWSGLPAPGGITAGNLVHGNEPYSLAVLADNVEQGRRGLLFRMEARSRQWVEITPSHFEPLQSATGSSVEHFSSILSVRKKKKKMILYLTTPYVRESEFCSGLPPQQQCTKREARDATLERFSGTL